MVSPGSFKILYVTFLVISPCPSPPPAAALLHIQSQPHISWLAGGAGGSWFTKLASNCVHVSVTAFLPRWWGWAWLRPVDAGVQGWPLLSWQQLYVCTAVDARGQSQRSANRHTGHPGKLQCRINDKYFCSRRMSHAIDHLKETKKMLPSGINVLKETAKNRFSKVWFLFSKKSKRIMYFYMTK